MDELVARFRAIGLDERKARETARSEHLSVALSSVLDDAGVTPEAAVPRAVGVLLYALAATCPAEALAHRAYVVRRVLSGAICRDDQLSAALAHVRTLAADAAVDDAAFDAACGVGVVVDDATVASEVSAVLDAQGAALGEQGYAYPLTAIVRDARARPALRWAEGRAIKAAIDAALAERLGPRSAWQAAGRGPAVARAPPKAAEDARAQFVGDVAGLHKPGENPQLSEEIRQAHLAATGGRVVTRFPPEPNGFLHIGHAKAMSLDFRYAQAHGGVCYLRFDDTNPEAEEPRYYEAIRDAVAWLGFAPHRETSTSDYFAYLHDVAVRLIERGRAYVCHMTPEEIDASRGGPDRKGARYDSPWRGRPAEESLREFARMRAGEYAEGAATLRLKMDMQSANPRMWDLVAYRVLYAPHCATGTQWCIYPMYDYSHCLVDSAENVTHSMCTTEYVGAREAYYWVCDAAAVYKPVQWEFARLAISHTVLSKRRLTELVSRGLVAGWDDPRLYTIAGLRRRGYTPAAINAFVEDVGVTTVFSVVDAAKLEAFVRDDLNRTAPRRMAVLDPLVLELVDGWHAGLVAELPGDVSTGASADATTGASADATTGASADAHAGASAHASTASPAHASTASPGDASAASPADAAPNAANGYRVAVTQTLFIDRSDFCAADAPDSYFRLTPRQPVGLYKLGVASYVSHECTPDGAVARVRVALDRRADAPKPKTFVTWLPADAPAAEVRMYGRLFRSREPDAAPGGYLADIDPASLRVIADARVDARLADVAPMSRFQFQRVGYFCADADSVPGRPVFNLTVSLREDPLKDASRS